MTDYDPSAAATLTLRALGLIRMWDSDSPLNHVLATEQQGELNGTHEGALMTVTGLMNVITYIAQIEADAGRLPGDLIAEVERRARHDGGV